MAKSMRSKRKQRLRSLRREIAEPFYEKKEAAKLAAQQAALEAPKLPVRVRKNESEADVPAETSTAMDVEVADGVSSHGDDSKALLKPVGGIGKKKLKRQLLLKKLKRRGRGKGKARLRRSRKV
ncbi:uncharacterized protein LOC110116151 [Dendrobium catenatum]|uniref:uncharacterized protein LOC110116151 n=1 Tax=Dendrobium catenatum TaxID=906689 RepID=UPI0009F4E72D|nr:uncharacterized protein LOC110116151 [Dendrobium catenatum]